MTPLQFLSPVTAANTRKYEGLVSAVLPHPSPGLSVPSAPMHHDEMLLIMVLAACRYAVDDHWFEPMISPQAMSTSPSVAEPADRVLPSFPTRQSIRPLP